MSDEPKKPADKQHPEVKDLPEKPEREQAVKGGAVPKPIQPPND